MLKMVRNPQPSLIKQADDEVQDMCEKVGRISYTYSNYIVYYNYPHSWLYTVSAQLNILRKTLAQ